MKIELALFEIASGDLEAARDLNSEERRYKILKKFREFFRKLKLRTKLCGQMYVHAATASA